MLCIYRPRVLFKSWADLISFRFAKEALFCPCCESTTYQNQYFINNGLHRFLIKFLYEIWPTTTKKKT